MKLAKLWVVGVMLQLLPFAGVAQERDVVDLTLEDALHAAKKRNRGLVVERARLAQAQTNVEQAWSALFPTIAVQGRYTHNYKEVELGFAGSPLLLQPSNQLDGVFSLSAPLIAPAAYPALAAVKAGVRVSEANYDISENAILISVAQMFYAASIADEMVVARQSSVNVARSTLVNATTRFEAGTVTKVDVDRAQMAVMRTEQMEREAHDGQAHAYRALATLIEMEGPFRVKLQSMTPEMHDEGDLASALHLRPEFRALEAAAKSANEQANAHKWRWAPTVSAFGNARRFNYDNFASDRHAWALGAQLDWVLYDGGLRDAQRHLAQAQVAEAMAKAEVLRANIRDTLVDGRRKLETKLAGARTAERFVELAKETVELVRVQYEAGATTQIELLQAQDALVAAHEGLAQAHYDLAAADLALRHAAGTFPPR
jgi:outer membrane protein TolC